MEYQALAHLGNSILVQNYNKTPEQALEEFMPLLEGSAELFLSSRQRPRHKRRR
jgi:hypothetical protein